MLLGEKKTLLALKTNDEKLLFNKDVISSSIQEAVMKWFGHDVHYEFVVELHAPSNIDALERAALP